MAPRNRVSSREGLISELKRFSTHDGPGIRTTVFFKGCPLRCSWCSNPETIDPHRDLFVMPGRCQHLGRCLEACPEGAIRLGPQVSVDRARCNLCMICATTCPSRTFQAVGREESLDEVMAEIVADRPFYVGGGGVTLGGGEPLAQPEFALSLLAACREAGIGTVLDTSGFAGREVVEQAARLSDLVLLDLKHMDPEAHRRETGADNRTIIENAEVMSRLSRVRISVPLVPGFNDTEENVGETAEFSRTIGALAVDINPMHILGTDKYRALGKLPPYDRFGALDPDHVRRLARIVREHGLEVTVGRMM